MLSRQHVLNIVLPTCSQHCVGNVFSTLCCQHVVNIALLMCSQYCLVNMFSTLCCQHVLNVVLSTCSRHCAVNMFSTLHCEHVANQWRIQLLAAYMHILMRRSSLATFFCTPIILPIGTKCPVFFSSITFYQVFCKFLNFFFKDLLCLNKITVEIRPHFYSSLLKKKFPTSFQSVFKFCFQFSNYFSQKINYCALKTIYKNSFQNFKNFIKNFVKIKAKSTQNFLMIFPTFFHFEFFSKFKKIF